MSAGAPEQPPPPEIAELRAAFAAYPKIQAIMRTRLEKYDTGVQAAAVFPTGRMEAHAVAVAGPAPPAAVLSSLATVLTDYTDGVNQQISMYRRSGVADGLTTIGVPAAAAIVSWGIGSVAALVASLGLGSINAGTSVTKGQSILKDYWGKVDTLRKSVTYYKALVDTCDPNDSTQVNQVKSQILEALHALAGS